MSGRSQSLHIARFEGDVRKTTEDQIAIEEPLEIRLGFDAGQGRQTRTVSVTMRTPGNDEELAAGFLFGEAIIQSADDIAFVKPCSGDNTVRVELESGITPDITRLERHFYTTSSCGVCGKASLDALRVNGLAPLPPGGLAIDTTTLAHMPDRLRDTQAIFTATGGLHAAAAFDRHGEILITHEDVGRHNAVDKVVGDLLLAGKLPAAELGLIVSGRASFELMQKALVAGMPLLAAVGAPSSLAVELAREFNVTLVGFLRGTTFNVYAAEERIKG